ncbi:MAG: hypothetical protein R3D68_05840 [Hyphomicrobiaceae bacterium]
MSLHVSAPHGAQAAVASSVAAQDLVSARYLVTADASSGMLSRLVEACAKLDVVPSRLHASREDGDGAMMTVDLRLTQVEARTAELVEFGLRRIVGVSQLISAVDA